MKNPAGEGIIKIACILRGDAAEPVAAFRDRVLGPLATRILGQGPRHLKLSTTAMEPPRFFPIPCSRERIALVSIWSEGGPGRKADEWARLVAGFWEGPVSAYRVEESIPVSYERTWLPGERTPGIGLLTLFRPRPGISRDAFLAMWHQGHTPLALKVHPLWNYVRNVVEEVLMPDSPVPAGIVEEHCRSEANLLTSWRFFGGPLAMVPNMIRITLDIRKWMDLRGIQNYLIYEYWIK